MHDASGSAFSAGQRALKRSFTGHVTLPNLTGHCGPQSGSYMSLSCCDDMFCMSLPP